MSGKSLQRALPPMEVQRVDSPAEQGPQSGLPRALPEISLVMAKAQIGGALHTTIHVTGSALKEFGDPSQVKRVCDGEVPGPLARAWQCPVRRKALVMALVEASGLFDVHTTITGKKAS